MKILHTSDWHIGRTLNEKSLLEDQEAMLTQLLAWLDRERPDILLVAGDIYDRSVPSKEALGLVDTVLSEIILRLGIPVLLIGGNHDGRERLAMNGGILEKQGLHIAGNYLPGQEPVTLGDEWGEVCFWSVPFIKPVEYRSLMKLEKTMGYDEMYREITAEITGRMDTSKRNVLVSHGLILGNMADIQTIDDSVRPIEIGGIEYACAEIFEAFDYVALGHLHRPQKALWDKVRYSGSLLKYSFSEWNQKKSVTLVELGEKGALSLEPVSFKPLRDLRVIHGRLGELTALEAYETEGREDYLKVILEDQERLVNPMDKLRRVYPNVLEMAYEKREKTEAQKSSRRIKERIQDPLKLFEDFYTFVNGEAMQADEQAVITELLETTMEEER